MELAFEQTEYITPMLIRGWLANRRIVCYQPKGTVRATVDAWFQTTVQTAHNWPSDQLYLELHDMRWTTVTPYSGARAQELIKALSRYHGRAAIVIADNRLGELMGVFVNQILNAQRQNLHRRVFTSPQTAQNWLEEVLVPIETHQIGG